jgi:predicted ester cyclase
MNAATQRATSSDLANRAKAALERVCSGACLSEAGQFYSPAFADHVNDLEFSGLEGANQSVSMYKSIFSELAITVEDQTVDGDRVTSRFVVDGTCRGRHVRFNGITISRFADGMIVEDWSVTDALGMLRQLGPWRSVVVGLSQWRALMRVRASSARRPPPGAVQSSPDR